jgi:hypothetical protein
MAVEFEVPDRRTVALQDRNDFTIFLQEASDPVRPAGCALWFQVEDVDATFSEWRARGVVFAHAPRKSYWGYGGRAGGPRRIHHPPVGRALDEGTVTGTA